MLDKSISVILPIYNEDNNIYDVIKAIFKVLPSVTDDFEVIAVDDGSIDRTKEILENLKSLDNRLKVIRHPKNMGYGVALCSGFKKAEKELIFTMDADRQFDISEIVKLIPYIKDYDIVAGFRIERSDSFYRRALGYCFNLIINILFGIKIKDINCGFKLYKRDFLQKTVLITKGALISAEIMYWMHRNKLKIKEVGVNHYPRIYGRPTGASFKVILVAILELCRLMQRLLNSYLNAGLYVFTILKLM